MITELMLILIVVGAGIVFVVWSNSRKRKRDELERREVEESTNKFKEELEKTANEIIGRMENQAAHLESLLDDSERNRAQLEGRVIELKKLLKRSEGQSTEIRDLLERLDDAVDDVSAMQKQMDVVERKINAAINVQIPQPVLNPVPQMITQPLMNPLMQNQQVASPQIQQVPVPPQVQSPIVPPQIIRTPAPVAEQTPAPAIQKETPPETFSKVLEKSMAEENFVPKTVDATPKPVDRNSIVLSRETKNPATAVNAEPVKIESPATKPANKLPTVPINLSETIADRQAKVLAKRQGKLPEKPQPTEIILKTAPPPKVTERSAEIRKAAVAAIKNATEQENTIELSPIEGLQSSEKIQSLKARAASLGEKPAEVVKFDSGPDSTSIRDMLLSGMSVEEIARETGLGRGAIELVQQMAKKQLERR